MLPKVQKVDPRVIRTRNSILSAFRSLLEQKSFEAISVQMITETAQVNRATFYAHFSDKYELLDVTIAELFLEEIEKRTLNMCHYSPENLKNLILALCQFLSRLHHDCPQPHPQFDSLAEAQIKQQLFALFSKWLSDANPKIPAELPATVATWAIYGIADHYSRSKKKMDLNTYVDEAFPLVAVNLQQFS